MKREKGSYLGSFFRRGVLYMSGKHNVLREPMVITRGQARGINSQIKIRDLFPNPQSPLHVDLGTGRGKFLRQAATKFPYINWIGIESNAVELMRARTGRFQQKNLSYIWMYIEQLNQIFSKGEVNRFHIQFCTPFEDSIRTSRQMTFHRFFSTYRELLAPDGDLIFKTDHSGLYEFTLEQIEKANWEIIEEVQNYAASSLYDKQLSSQWEQDVIRSRKPIYYLQLSPRK
jgi:tRNA (guanine-N7-)-methyltransferase